MVRKAVTKIRENVAATLISALIVGFIGTGWHGILTLERLVVVVEQNQGANEDIHRSFEAIDDKHDRRLDRHARWLFSIRQRESQHTAETRGEVRHE